MRAGVDMGEYEILIFITVNKIQAIEVSSYGEIKNICFQGNKELNYNGIEGIEAFYASLTDTYNVDDIAEMDTNVYIVDCGADKEVKWTVADKFKQCNVLDVISINKLLPFALIRNNMVKAGEKAVVGFMGDVYAYICDNDMKFEELSTRGKKPQKELQAEDFAFWVMMDANGCGTDSGNNDAELENIQREYQEKLTQSEKVLNNLRTENQSLNVRLEEYQQKIVELENIVPQKIADKIVRNRRIVSVKESSTFEMYTMQDVKQGEIVKANDVIGGLSYSRKDPTNYDIEIYACRDGKVAWLQLNGDSYHNEDYGYSKWDMAVMGDEEDDVDAMIEWYWEQKKAEKNTEKKA